MSMLEVIPQEFYDGVPVAAVASLDGELLAALEDTPAGPWLAQLLGAVEPSRLSTWELPTYLRAAHRVQAWGASLVADGVGELACRPDVVGVDKEVALALREPVGAAQTRIHWCTRLRRLLPGVRQVFGWGELSERHVIRLVEATAGVNDPELMARIEERVLPTIGGKTAGELARRVRDVVKRLDPAGVQRRAREARDQADVTLYPDGAGAGMCDVVMHEPIEDGTLIKNGCDAYAATLKAAGDPRPIGALRAEAPVRWASDYLTGRTTGCNSGTGRAPTSGGRPIEIGITLPLRTALGLDDLPGEVPGLGIIPRDVIAAMIRAELPKLRLLVIDPDSGRLLHRATSSYRPTAAQVAQVRATYVFSVGPGSKILAVRCDTDHAQPWPVGPTAIGQLVPLDRTWHESKTKGQLNVTVDDRGAVTVTTVSGQTRNVTPYDYRMTHEAETDTEDNAEPPPG